MGWQTELGIVATAHVLGNTWTPVELESLSHTRSLMESPSELVWVDVQGMADAFRKLLQDFSQRSAVLKGMDAGKASKPGETPPKLPPKARAFHGFVFARAYWMSLGEIDGHDALLTQEIHLVVAKSFAVTLRYPCRGWDLTEVATRPTIALKEVGDLAVGFRPQMVREDVMSLRDRRDQASREVFGVEVAAAVLDQVVDSVFDALDRLREEQADRIEGEVLQRDWLWLSARQASRPTLDDRMLGLRRLLRQVRWAFLPSDEIDEFLSGPFLGISDPVIKFKFKDLEREADRAISSVRDLIEQVDQSAQLSQGMRTDRLNKTMYVLTAVATVLLVPTVIAGIYGMNFQHMPELGWRMGYFGALVGMVVLGGVMWVAISRFLRKR
jgi:Mg2+ and Co2+ transporter CorA